MGQPSSKDEMTVRHQFDRLCQMALKGEAANYYKHMDYRRKHEVTFSELSSHQVGSQRCACSFQSEREEMLKHYIEAKVWSEKNLTKCVAVTQGDEAYL